MGWSSGSYLFSEIVQIVRDSIQDYEDRVEFYRRLISLFEDRDCDTLHECLGDDEAFDTVWKELYPDYDSDYGDESETNY